MKRPNRSFWLGALALVLGLAIWIVVSLRNDDSILSIVVRGEIKHIGWSADSTTGEVLLRMAKYEDHGKYDDAIKAGVAWTNKYPDKTFDDLVFTNIAFLYLRKAQADARHSDEYVKKAVLYRDKALPSEADSIPSLENLARLSEGIADFSQSQRCAQYRNAITLLNRQVTLLNDEHARLARQIVPQRDEAEHLGLRRQNNDATMRRIQEKLRTSACQ
jgi:hypothetical protein